MASPNEVVLYKMREGWSMPCIGPGSLAVEAYLRFTGKPFSVEVCPSHRSSPTGHLPCLEWGDTLVGTPAPAVMSDEAALEAQPDDQWGLGGILGAASCTWSEFDAALVCIRFLRRKVVDLDAHLTARDRGVCDALHALVSAKLVPAVLHATWVDRTAFAKHTSKEYFAALPFPLNWTQPRATRGAICAMLRTLPAEQLYSEACAALEALEHTCAGSGGYLMGQRPTSIDASVLAIVWFMRNFPGLPRDLGEAVQSCPSLNAYVDRLAAEHFATAARPADPDRHYRGDTPVRGKPPMTQSEAAHRRGNVMWLLGASAVVVGYFLLGGMVTLPIGAYESVVESLAEGGGDLDEDGMGAEDDIDDFAGDE